MPEMEEELSVLVLSEDIQFIASPSKDSIIIKADLSNEEAATMAWLSNHIRGTKLKLEIKLDEVQAKRSKE